MMIGVGGLLVIGSFIVYVVVVWFNIYVFNDWLILVVVCYL